MTTTQVSSYVTKYAISYFDVIEYEEVDYPVSNSIEDKEQMPTIDPDYNDMFEIIDIECNDDLSISNTDIYNTWITNKLVSYTIKKNNDDDYEYTYFT